MKRIGYLYEEFLTKENFISAESLLGRNKRHNKRAKYISKHSKYYGEKLYNKIISGEFKWHPYRTKTITDSYKGKTRDLKIPCLEDQAVQLAWLNIATPYLMKRFYYYSCGSVPAAGQTRIVKAIKKWLKNGRNKYAASLDIRKFYDTCPHKLVEDGLRRIFKDERFIRVGMSIVESMSDTDYGLAIGFPSSHWFANIALMELDNTIKHKFPEIKMVRYMDDIALISSNRRKLKKAVLFICNYITEKKMTIKRFGLYEVQEEGLSFLSYRFFIGKTILVKKLMFRICRRIRKAVKTVNAHIAKGIIAYFGILKWCNSYNFKQSYIFPFINTTICKNLIRKERTA